MSLLLLGDDVPVVVPVIADDRYTINDARKAVYQRWIAQWVTPGGNPPTYYDNVVARPPTTAHVELVVRHLGSMQYTLGAVGQRRFERTAVCLVTIRVPTNQGTLQADVLAQKAMDVFEGVELAGGLVFYQVQMGEVGPLGDMYEVVVRATFHYYETK